MPRRILLTPLLALSMLAASAASAQVAFRNTPYLSVADNEIVAAFPTTHWIENFEGVLSLNMVASGGTVLAPGSLTDSVDGDDGAVDGSGTAGHSWYSNAAETITFTFSTAALGTLPTWVGIAFTDVGLVPGGTIGTGTLGFEAFDGTGALLGGVSLSFGDGSAAGGTAEDRFQSVRYAGGIGSIRVGFSGSLDWEVDHLTAAVVPEPATWALLLGGVALLGVSRRMRA